MKKILVILSVAALLASLVSCGPVDYTASDANLEDQVVEQAK